MNPVAASPEPTGPRVPDGQMVVCGMSLGYADMSRIENPLVTEREPVSSFARFIEQDPPWHNASP